MVSDVLLWYRAQLGRHRGTVDGLVVVAIEAVQQAMIANRSRRRGL